MQKWLRSFGAAGNFLANAITFLTTNWVLTVSAVTAFLVSLWDQAVEVLGYPRTQATILAFVAVLWTLIGIRMLITQGRPRQVKFAHEDAYSLIVENIEPNYNPKIGTIRVLYRH
jgi:hypothetical protein